MAQEEQTQRYSSNSSGGGSGGFSKKLKQRGLGVAQLEKIRLEEQQKKDVAASTIFSPSLPNSIFRPPPFTPSVEAMRPNSVQAISSSGRGNWFKFGEYNNLEGEHKLDHQGSAFRSNVNLSYKSNTPICPLPAMMMQRSEQFQRPCPTSSMVNVPSATSSSSVMNFQIEPPSNQIYRPLWPEEERRSYPFSIDDAPGPSFNSRFPPAYASPTPGTDETASCSNEDTFNIKPAANPVLREGPSSSSGTSEPKMRRVVQENGVSNDGDFLTLAPPKPKHPSSHLIPHPRELPYFDDLPYQGTTDEIVKWPGPGRSLQQPFFSFLPSANTQNDQSAATISNGNGIIESLDLNLKL